jgi:molybdenum cofactor cytidylyltransferase/nicotine blue oxidoreductase
MHTTAGLVLAAGEGRRFGGPKAPFVLDGERLVDRAVRVLRDAGCDPVVVVLGAWVGDVDGATVVVNDDWSTGMGSSLRAGLGHLGVDDAIDRAVVTLVDLPGLTAEAVRRLASERGDLAQAAYDGERGHPVLLGRAHWAGVAATAEGDRGARAYLAQHDVALVEVGDVASGHDLDLRPE